QKVNNPRMTRIVRTERRGRCLTPSPSPRGEDEKPHPQPLSKGRGEVVSSKDAMVRTGAYRQNL
ncbi:MAG: hypothetical protein SPE73_07800, partial [Prevotella sp.]|nr:hypothetical protein [Prevotella sp.]